MSGSCRRPSRMSGTGREALPDVREWWNALQDVRQWSVSTPKCPGVVGSPSRKSRSGQEALPYVRLLS